MDNNSHSHRYQIIFQGGEIIYEPLKSQIIVNGKKQALFLLPKKKLSLFSGRLGIRDAHISDFNPICLTIYASHHCNLDCTYCYIPKKETYPNEFIDLSVVESGAKIVANNCVKQKIPFTVGFHGGNEPLLHPEKLEKYLAICNSVAIDNDLKFLPFCTTNGVISEDTAYWAAKKFYGISLSWDGPAEIHDAFRKDISNNKTSQHVERTARIFAEHKKNSDIFIIRCTVTSLSVDKMEEIARYFHGIGAKIVVFYPVFRNRDHPFSDKLIPEPQTFVYNFHKARKYGLANGLKVIFSGSRLKDFHNRFCSILQDNLTITPDGFLTNCFHHTQNYDNQDNLFLYGKFNTETNQLEYDRKKMKEIIKIYNSELNECTHCFNQFHCSHGCPDICSMTDHYSNIQQPDCIKEKWLGLAAILEKAGYIKEFKTKSEFIDFFQNITCHELK